MKTKRCTTCQTILPVSFFSKAKKGLHGVKSCCKVCMATYLRAYREKNLGLLQEYDRKNNKSKKAKRKKRSLVRPEQYLVNNAIRLKKMCRPLFCVRCWDAGTIHGHHTDYSRPLDVIWLCSKCHGMEHGTRIY